MEKHPIDLIIEREAKAAAGIEAYFDNLLEKKYEHFYVERFRDEGYFVHVTLNELKFFMAYIVTVPEVYEMSTKIEWRTIDELVEAYIQERIASDVLAFLNGEIDELDSDDKN